MISIIVCVLVYFALNYNVLTGFFGVSRGILGIFFTYCFVNEHIDNLGAGGIFFYRIVINVVCKEYTGQRYRLVSAKKWS